MPRPLIWLLTAALVVLSGCAAPPPELAREVGPSAFAEEIAGDARVAVNVHTPDEGSIGGTDLTIPFDQVAARADELPADRDTPLAIYCMTGRMSREAAATLAGLGYTDVVELAGGMQAWAADGLPLDPARP